jgi:hypothetical protein
MKKNITIIKYKSNALKNNLVLFDFSQLSWIINLLIDLLYYKSKLLF